MIKGPGAAVQPITKSFKGDDISDLGFEELVRVY